MAEQAVRPGIRPSRRPGVLMLTMSFLCASPCGPPSLLGQIPPDVKISGTSGPNAVSELDACCYDDPRPPECDDCDHCLRTTDCHDPGHPDWSEPPAGAVCCDDDPKHHQEPSITAARWNPDALLAVFMDRSRAGVGVSGYFQNAFAVSRDGGDTWERFDRDNEFYPDPCAAPLPTFVSGYARSEEDICMQDEQGWGFGNGDPCTATGGDGWLYFTGGPPYFARLRLDPETLGPMGAWQAVLVPRGDAPGGGDKPFVSADHDGSAVYVLWVARAGAADQDPWPVFLTVSCDHGAEFFADPPGGCPVLDPSAGIQLSYLSHEPCTQPECTWGAASVVGPTGDVHFIWPVRDYYAPGIDQIFLRSLRWDVSGQPHFDPPLPEGDDCTAEPGTCELAIIHDQPDIGGPGYGDTFVAPLLGSMNIGALTHPSIAVDRTDPEATCGFGGNLYVAYAAQEPLHFEGCTDPNGCIDSNIYVVHSRDGGLNWSAPVRIDTHDVPEEVYEHECLAPACGLEGTAGMTRRPVQFYPWIAADAQGRVGVMWHETYPDFNESHPNSDPCDGNVIYNISFAWSYDGGVTWVYGWEISEEVSQTGVGPGPPWLECGSGISLGEYSGLTATSNDQDEGVFHAIWTDFREYTSGWRGMQLPGGVGIQQFMGDIYTTKVVLDHPVCSMGDFDRDFDVDMDDYANYPACAQTPLPPLCEILDLNRNNAIDNMDTVLFMRRCFTGGGEGGDGFAPAGEGGGSAEDGLEPLDAMVSWCLGVMSADERAVLAEAVREAAEGAAADEAALMLAFADTIDPGT